MTTVGIDFGTTNSALAAWTGQRPELAQLSAASAPYEWERAGYSPLMPSVFGRRGDESLFGFAALQDGVARFEAVKRLFTVQEDIAYDSHNQPLMVEEVATLLFAEILRRAREDGYDPMRAVVTVPANSRGLARHRTKICAGMAGIQVLSLINEPTAAALAYAAGSPGDQTILVFDWGGGTLDVTVLRSIEGIFIEEASAGLPRRGGRDFDSRLQRLVLETIPDAASLDRSERDKIAQDTELAKIRLSTLDEADIVIPGRGSHRITRNAFNAATRSLVDEAQTTLEECLAVVGIDATDIDALIMVGGTSCIPAVRSMVSSVIGREPESAISPLTAVAEGAAIAAAVLTGEASDRYDLVVSTEHALGTITLDSMTLQLEFDELIERNRPIPREKTKRYSPVFEGQEAVTIRVIEGDPSKSIDHPDNVVLKEFDVSLDPVAEDPSFELTYLYDAEGMLKVTVERSDGTSATESIGFGPVGLDPARMVEIARTVKHVVENADAGKLVPAISRDPEVQKLVQDTLAKVIPFLDEDEALPIHRLVTRLQQTEDETEQAAALADLRDALVPYWYLLTS
jgi:molecular chaperone DnaK (HSP70)